MAPVEFLSMGHSSSLVFAHLVEVDGLLSLQGHGPVPMCLPEVPSRQRTPGGLFHGVLGCETLSSDTRVGHTDQVGEEGTPEDFPWGRLFAVAKAALYVGKATAQE